MGDIDLFAGDGGLAIGLERARFAPVALYEKDNLPAKTLRRNITERRRRRSVSPAISSITRNSVSRSSLNDHHDGGQQDGVKRADVDGVPPGRDTVIA